MAKIKSTMCTVQGCNRAYDGRGYCKTHYSRWRATGEPLRPCGGCGQDVVKRGNRDYCSDGCRPTCSVDGCWRKITVKGGSWCQLHRKTINKNAGALPAYLWATEKMCLVCGASDWPGKGRKACSPRCQQLLVNSGGVPPERFKQCVRCPEILDLFETGKGGRKRRADVQLCKRCRLAKYKRHATSVTVLAARDGIGCGICGEDVDMTLEFPELFRASVDHILPFASGGTHDPENLQLSHLWCNLVKQNRAGFTI